MSNSQQTQFLDALRDVIATAAAKTMSSAEFAGNFLAGRYDPEQIQDMFFTDNPRLKYVTYGDDRHDYVFAKIFKENADEIRVAIYTMLWNTALKDIGNENYELRTPINEAIYKALAILFNINNDLMAYGRLGMNATTAKFQAEFLKPCVQFATGQLQLDAAYALPLFTEKPIRQTPPPKPKGFKKLFNRGPQSRQFKDLSEIRDELADTVNSKSWMTGATAINIIDNLARLENKRSGGLIESRYQYLGPDVKEMVLENFGQEYKELLGTAIILTHEDFIMALAGYTVEGLSVEITGQIRQFQKKYPAHLFFMKQVVIPQLEASNRKQERANAATTSSQLFEQVFTTLESTGLTDFGGRPIMKKKTSATVIRRPHIIPSKQK